MLTHRLLETARAGPLTSSLSVAVLDRRRGNLLHFAVASFHAGEVVLYDLFPAFAEVFTQRVFYSFVDLIVGRSSFAFTTAFDGSIDTGVCGIDGLFLGEGSACD